MNNIEIVHPTTPVEVTNLILFLWIGSLVVSIISFLVIYFKINPTGAETYALHYTVLVGVDLLGKGTDLYKLPLVGVLMTGVNYGAYRLVKMPGNVLSFFLALISVVVNLVLFVAVLFLLQVN
jgi:hypothetical protein